MAERLTLPLKKIDFIEWSIENRILNDGLIIVFNLFLIFSDMSFSKAEKKGILVKVLMKYDYPRLVLWKFGVSLQNPTALFLNTTSKGMPFLLLMLLNT